MEMIRTGISGCEMNQCSYNSGGKCMAIAVNIGGPHQMCDTFISEGEKGGMQEPAAMVGACKVKSCGFNKNLLCMAKNIKVGPHEGHPDCVTYRAL
jgi:hypothetical protein